jgi:hypothetical protein
LNVNVKGPVPLIKTGVAISPPTILLQRINVPVGIGNVGSTVIVSLNEPSLALIVLLLLQAHGSLNENVNVESLNPIGVNIQLHVNESNESVVVESESLQTGIGLVV